VPSLDALARLAERGVLDLVAVVTQPDRPGDRRRVTAPPVKERAQALGLPILQPPRLDPQAVAAIRGLAPTVLVWAAYGNIVPRQLIDAVRGRCVNVHASLLPRWRGAAPIAHAILAGDGETGITLMEANASLDAGPILAVERTPILPDEDAGALTDRLAEIGGNLLELELAGYLAGTLPAVPQPGEGVTWAPKLTSQDGALDFARPADELARRVRAFTPDPGAFTTVRGRRLKVIGATVAGGVPQEHGTLVARDGVPHVAAGAGWLRLDRVQPEGRAPMRGDEWLRGVRDAEGSHVPS